MNELDLILKDVEEYYSNTEKKHYNLVKGLRDKPLFTFDTMLKFTAMYKYDKVNGANTSESGLNKHFVIVPKGTVCTAIEGKCTSQKQIIICTRKEKCEFKQTAL